MSEVDYSYRDASLEISEVLAKYDGRFAAYLVDYQNPPNEGDSITVGDLTAVYKKD